ncbi:unnamed protein product, partial [Ixodes pacificus]
DAWDSPTVRSSRSSIESACSTTSRRPAGVPPSSLTPTHPPRYFSVRLQPDEFLPRATLPQNAPPRPSPAQIATPPSPSEQSGPQASRKTRSEDPEPQLLPPHFKVPEDCRRLLHHLEATDEVDLCDETLPGSTTIKASAIILVMSFLTAYGLSWCALDDQLRLIDTLFGSKESVLPNSK